MWLAIRSGEQTGRIVEVTGERFVIGRDDDCSLKLPDEKISRKHASLTTHADGRVILQDLGSTNGTFVDEQRITSPVELTGNEQVRVGDTMMIASVHAPSAQATAIGVMHAGGPVPPPRRTGFTAERLMLRRSANRATIIGAIAAGLALLAIAALAFFWVTGEDDPGPAAGGATAQDIVDAARPATVRIDAQVDGQVIGGGSGWVLDADEGLVVTNAHVVNAGQTFLVGVNSGNADPEADLQARSASVVASAPCEDLAILKVDDTTGLDEVELGSQAELNQGETVVALGYPASASTESNLSSTVGVVSVVKETFDLKSLDVPNYSNVIRTDAAINPGNSGGPLFDLDENLVGVNSAGITLLGGRTIQGESFAIGVDRVKEISATLRQGQSTAWAGAGLTHPTGINDITSLGFPEQAGIIISHVVPGTSAEAAGLGEQPHLLVAVNGTPIDNSLPSYCDAVADVASGQPMTYSVIKPGQSTSTDVEVIVE